MSFAKDDRKNQSIHGKTLHGERFSDAIAHALHREFDHTYAAIKTVVALTGANERAVRNWFDAKNGPNGEFLIATALTPRLGTAHLSKSAVSRIVGRLKALFATWQGLDLSAERVCDRVLGRISSERAPGLGGHPKPAIN